MRGHFGVVFHVLSNGEVSVQSDLPYLKENFCLCLSLSMSLSLSCLRDLELDPEALRLVNFKDHDCNFCSNCDNMT